MTRAMPVVRPGFIKISAVVLLLLVPAAAHAVWDYVEARRLRVRLEVMAARGEPLTAESQRPVPLSGGAADADRFYRAAAALEVWTIPPPPMPYRINQAMRDGIWPADVRQEVHAMLERNVDALALVDRAAPLPFEEFESGVPFNPLAGQLMLLEQLCDRRAALLALDGQGDRAVASLYSEARLGRAVSSLHGFTVPPAFRALTLVLNRGQPSTAARRMLADALEALDRDDYMKQHFLRMTARLLDDYRKNRVEWSSPTHTVETHMVVARLDEYSALARAAEQPWPRPLQAVPSLASPRGQGLMNRRDLLQEQATFWARVTQGIRCARLRVSDQRLVDPFSGRILTLADCKL